MKSFIVYTTSSVFPEFTVRVPSLAEAWTGAKRAAAKCGWTVRSVLEAHTDATPYVSSTGTALLLIDGVTCKIKREAKPVALRALDGSPLVYGASHYALVEEEDEDEYTASGHRHIEIYN